jgi:hypothetical protein
VHSTSKIQQRHAVSLRRFSPSAPLLLCALYALGNGSLAMATPPPPPPAKDRIATCRLNATAVKSLKQSLKSTTGLAESNVDFALVYSLANPNDGQPTTDGYTGPVLCINPESVTYPPTPTSENTPVGPAGQAWNITDLEQALLLQYRKTDGVIEKRVCHTVAGNTDCFLIKRVEP